MNSSQKEFIWLRTSKVAPVKNPKLQLTSGLTEVLTPRKFRPREDFPSNRSSELENPNRAGEIFRDGAKFGRRKMRRRPLE